MSLRTDYFLHDHRSAGLIMGEDYENVSHQRQHPGVIVHEKDELKRALESAFEDPDIGIILLTEKFSRDFPEYINSVKLRRGMPLIIDIPDRHGSGRRPPRSRIRSAQEREGEDRLGPHEI